MSEKKHESLSDQLDAHQRNHEDFRLAQRAEGEAADRIKELETAYAGERFRRAELETTVDEMIHALNMILPLARGYNAYQGTACPESNRQCIKAAEIALRNADAAIELCNHGAGS